MGTMNHDDAPARPSHPAPEVDDAIRARAAELAAGFPPPTAEQLVVLRRFFGPRTDPSR